MYLVALWLWIQLMWNANLVINFNDIEVRKNIITYGQLNNQFPIAYLVCHNKNEITLENKI